MTTATVGMQATYNGSLCVIVGVRNASANTAWIGGGGLQQVRHHLEIVKGNDLFELSEGHPWLTLRPDLPEVLNTSELRASALMKRDEVQAAYREKLAKSQREREEFEERARAIVPAWAKAAIIAESQVDDCDSMTDYFNVKTERTVILGFSKHTRDLFPEMRKFAANMEETAHLATPTKGDEHREKYSMGAGYYLKAGSGYATGWAIRKVRIDGTKGLPSGEFRLSEPAATRKPTAQPVSVDSQSEGMPAMTIEKHIHTKKGFEMWICVLADRVDRAEFDRLLNRAKDLGGWYTRQWGTTPGGYAFKSEDAANKFAGLGTPSPDGPRGTDSDDVGKTDAPSTQSPHLAARFRELADGMQAAIDHKLSDRRENTPKQQREAASARLDGWHLERTQKALRVLAGLHEAGVCPDELAGLKTKAAIHELTRAQMDRSGGYYDAGRETGEPYHDTPQGRAIWAMLSDNPAKRAAEELRQEIAGLKFKKIPGYFPTPAPIVSGMIAAAGIGPDFTGRILEPSAGSGAIADAVTDHATFADLTLYEVNPTLSKILERKGYGVTGSNFLEALTGPQFDRVLMNPPFEKGQDMYHVRHAFDMLKKGGRLVAIMSPGFTFRNDSAARTFRDWFEDRGGEMIKIDSGAFRESGTDVSTVMVILDRD